MICKLYVLKLYLAYEGGIAEDSYPDDINQGYRLALGAALVFQDSENKLSETIYNLWRLIS